MTETGRAFDVRHLQTRMLHQIKVNSDDFVRKKSPPRSGTPRTSTRSRSIQTIFSAKQSSRRSGTLISGHRSVKNCQKTFFLKSQISRRDPLCKVQRPNCCAYLVSKAILDNFFVRPLPPPPPHISPLKGPTPRNYVYSLGFVPALCTRKGCMFLNSLVSFIPNSQAIQGG